MIASLQGLRGVAAQVMAELRLPVRWHKLSQAMRLDIWVHLFVSVHFHASGSVGKSPSSLATGLDLFSRQRASNITSRTPSMMIVQT